MFKILMLAALSTTAALAQLPQPTKSINVFIAASTALSEPVDLGTCVPVAFVVPTISPAANFSFQSSVTGTSYTDVYDSYDTLITVATGPGTTGRTIAVPPGDWYYARYLKIRRGTPTTPVNTTANLNFTISCK